MRAKASFHSCILFCSLCGRLYSIPTNLMRRGATAAIAPASRVLCGGCRLRALQASN